MKGAIGSSQSLQHRSLQLDRGLLKLANQVINEEQQKAKVARIAKAAKAPQSRASKGKVLLTDEEVLECRTLHEIQGWGIRALVRKYPNTSEDYIRRLLNYQVRAQPHLDPRCVRPA